MEFLQELWMPIVVSAVFVWIASFLMWMVMPFHKGEWKALKDEAQIMGALTELGVQPGSYMFPFGSSADMKNPEFMERCKRGPNGMLVVWPGMTNMGMNMLLGFIVYLVVGLFVAYVGWHTIPADAHYLHVFRVCGAAAVGFYCLGWMPSYVWFRAPGRFWTSLFDGIVYGLLTAGTFGWLWPRAAGG